MWEKWQIESKNVYIYYELWMFDGHKNVQIRCKTNHEIWMFVNKEHIDFNNTAWYIDIWWNVCEVSDWQEF